MDVKRGALAAAILGSCVVAADATAVNVALPQRPAVFVRLGELKPGDVVLVTRKDRTVVRFKVDGVKSFPKTAFPTELVYGLTDKPSLRLVTCGGKFNEKTRSYPDNIIGLAPLIP